MSLIEGDIKTRALMLSWDKPGGCLLTGLAVSGMKVARAQSRLRNGTGELSGHETAARGLTRAREGDPQVVKSRKRQSTGGVSERAERLVIAETRL